MENNTWDKAKIADWKRFWDSELGQDYLAKLDATKQMIFLEIMNNSNREVLSNLAGRAAGIEIIIQDIKQGILTAEQNEKEEKKTAKKTK